MINSFYIQGIMNTGSGFALSIIIGFFFGLVLEKAGFGSSRRLAGIFYFREMTVLKVMFTAVVVACLGFGYLSGFGFVDMGNIYLMPTIYGAQIIGGLVFGVGFVMSGWCPGTAAVGLASGSIDALIFLIGAIVGSIIYSETFAFIKPIANWGDCGVSYVYNLTGMSRTSFSFIFTLIAIACFWFAEFVEKERIKEGFYLRGQFLKAFSFLLFVAAAGLFAFNGSDAKVNVAGKSLAAITPQARLNIAEEGKDHISPEELADMLIKGQKNLLVIDIRPESEYSNFHIRGALNISMSNLPEFLLPYKNKGDVVIYSNGMTHPAQARDVLLSENYMNVYILTDGLAGFKEQCLKPVSLRTEPVSDKKAMNINAWRKFFLTK